MSTSPLDPKAAAAVLGVEPRTLEKWRRTGNGPRFVAYSTRCVRYQLAALEQFIAEREAANTAEAARQLRDAITQPRESPATLGAAQGRRGSSSRFHDQQRAFA